MVAEVTFDQVLGGQNDTVCRKLLGNNSSLAQIVDIPGSQLAAGEYVDLIYFLIDNFRLLLLPIFLLLFLFASGVYF